MAAFSPMGAKNELVSGLSSQRLSESSLAGSLGLVAEGTQLLLVAKLESTWSTQSVGCGILPISSAYSIRGQRTGWQRKPSPVCVCCCCSGAAMSTGGRRLLP